MTHTNLPPSRRDFLKASALGVAGAGVGATAISSRRAAADVGAKSARQKAAHRQRRVIYSDDGATLLHGEPTLKSYLSRRLDHVVDTHVDTVYFNTTMWDDRYSHYPDPKVGEFVLESATPRDGEWFHFAHRYRMLAEKEGKDVLQLSLEFCKSHNLEFLWTLRMNDVHDIFEVRNRCRFKQDNPHVVLGRPGAIHYPHTDHRHYWSVLDFAQEAVRNRRLGVIKDVLAQYDVDGIDLDFMRHPLFFDSVRHGKPASGAELDIMTGLVRKVRQQVLAASDRRGRPLLLSVRTPVTVELCNHVGLDIETWLAEGLIDVLVIGCGYMPLTMPAKALIDLSHKHNVPAYPCISHSGLKPPHAIPVAWRASASNLFADGADGVLTFNLEYSVDRGRFTFHDVLKTIGEPPVMADLDKMYGVDWTVAGGYMHHAVPNDGTLPFTLELNKEAGLTSLPVSDDVAAAERAGKLKSIDLRVETGGLGASDKVDLFLNGRKLQDVQREGQLLTCNPPVAAIKRGRNELGVTMTARTDDAGSAPQLTDIQLWVRYNS